MPRKDKTFGQTDLVRFWYYNLEAKEQRDVLMTFVYGMSLTDAFKSFLVVVLELAVSFLPLSPVWRKVLNTVLRLVGVKGILDSLLVRALAQRTLRKARLTDGEWARAVQSAKDVPFD